MAATIVQYLGTGRRKRSVARVFLRPGTGEIKVNNRAFENYFPTESTRAVVRQALAATETTDKFDLMILAQWRRRRRSGRRVPSGNFPGFSGVQCGTAGTVKEARLFDPRPAAARAQEVRPKRRSQAVPVLQTLSPREAWKAVGSPSGLCNLSTDIRAPDAPRKSRFGPRGVRWST